MFRLQIQVEEAAGSGPGSGFLKPAHVQTSALKWINLCDSCRFIHVYVLYIQVHLKNNRKVHSL